MAKFHPLSDTEFLGYSNQGSLPEIACYLGLEILLPHCSRRRRLLRSVPGLESMGTQQVKHPLALAVVQNHLAIVKHLVKNGARVNGLVWGRISRPRLWRPLTMPSYRSGLLGSWAPLTLACEVSDCKMIQFLLSAGARVNNRANPIPPLSIAAKRCEPNMVALLLAHGADISTKDPSDSGSAITRSITASQVKDLSRSLRCLRILLQAPKGPEVAQRHFNVHTATYWAPTPVLRELLDPKWAIDPSTRSKDNDLNTPLHDAYRFHKLEAAQLLLSHSQVDPNARNGTGATPLYLCCDKAYPDLARMLLSDGSVDPNAPNTKGRTPLSFACQRGSLRRTRLLLLHDKVDLNPQDHKG